MAELQLNLLGLPILAFLCGVELLLVLCHLKRKLYLPIFWKQRDVNHVSKVESLRDIKSFFSFQIDELKAINFQIMLLLNLTNFKLYFILFYLFIFLLSLLP